ncbi:MAG: alpha/beta hydrolase [Planctomycetota bacterium]|jgi:esterase/lipase superfamily enzyme
MTMERTRSPRLRACLVLTLLLAGCGPPTLMPTPVAFYADTDPIADTPADERTTTTRVFIATDRTPSGKTDDAATFYSNERDYGLRLGVATVEIGLDMTWDELHAESRREERDQEPAVALTGYEEFGALWTSVPQLQGARAEDRAVVDRFVAEVKAALEASSQKDIFIFIHGFNTKVPGNTQLAAELHHYLGRQGVMLSYEWPSQGSAFKYSADKAAAAFSARYLRLLLSHLARATGAHRIHLIAHSAGAPVAVGAIQDLCLMHFDDGPAVVKEKYRLGHLVLVAPDMDLGLFANAIHDEMTGVPEAITVYVSTRDRALRLSTWIYGFARLGAALTALTPKALEFLHENPAVEMIDVANAEKEHGSWLGHSYFHQDPWVSSDVLMTLRWSAEPADRGLELPEGSPIWSFPEDYPERARAAAAALYGGGAAATGN